MICPVTQSVSTVKFFSDDTSIFSVVDAANISADKLNIDLLKISEWVCKWEISFNHNLTKQAQEVVFSRKLNKSSHPESILIMHHFSVPIDKKHLGIYLDEFLNFSYHIKEKCLKQ